MGSLQAGRCRFAWQAGEGRAPMRLDARAELDPLRIAPLLRRLQPDFGWGGDLTIAGHVDIRSAPSCASRAATRLIPSVSSSTPSVSTETSAAARTVVPAASRAPTRRPSRCSCWIDMRPSNPRAPTTRASYLDP